MPCKAPWIFLVLIVPCICAPVTVPPANYIPDEYIVQLKPDLTAQDVLDRIPGASIGREYHIGTLHFITLRVNNEVFEPSQDIGIDLIPNVVVEGYQDQEPMKEPTRESVLEPLREPMREPVREPARESTWEPVREPVCYKQKTGRRYWGLTRISHKDLPDYMNEDSYLFNETAECVDIYVMDTGVNVEHDTFGGRAYRGYTSEEILSLEGTEDLSGHGTHVAALAAGRVHGVAKNANIISVKVFNASQSGSLSGILDGFDWISNQTLKNVQAGRKVRNVINMSWGFHDPVWRYEMLWSIIDSLPAVAVAAAGNRGVDACEFAPARFETVITVSGVDEDDNLVYDYGHCVDVLAPGVHILSAAHDDNFGEVEKSGTSMSAGYVTGVIARHLGSAKDQLSTADIRKILQRTSTKGKTNAAELGTPDLLAYASCDSGKRVEGIPRKPLHVESCGTSTPPGLAKIQALTGPSSYHIKEARDSIPTGPQIRVMGYGSNLMDTGTLSIISVGALFAVSVVVVVSVMFRYRHKVHCEQQEDEAPVVVTEDTASVISVPP